MKITKLCFIISVLMISINSNAQQGGEGKAKIKSESVATSSKLSLDFGTGTATYFGDLKEDNSLYKQNSFAFDAGLAYEFIPHLRGNLKFGILQITGDDSGPGGAHPSRNLSFKTTIFFTTINAELHISDLNKHKFGEYVSFGAGIATFTPTAVGSGGKVNLRNLRTEGQAVGQEYSGTTAIFPMVFGLEYKPGPVVSFKLDFAYVFTSTDYLDDVSMNGYPVESTLSPATKAFTWRGAGAYPANLKLPRGNPNKKDGFYTTQLKIGIALGK
jgi:hypothetical protein